MFKKFGITNEEKIKKYEELINMELPISYKKFLIETNGGSFEDMEHKFYVSELREEFIIDVMFGLNQDRNIDLEFWFNEYKDDLIECTAIIGDSLGTGLIVMIMAEDMKGIFLWDHCFELETSTEDNCIYKIADDFESFLEMVM